MFDRIQKLIGAEVSIAGIVMLSQGEATAPRALVMYQHPLDFGTVIVHEVNLQTPHLFNGSYFSGPNAIQDAYRDFYTRIEADVAYYLSKGIPLTDPKELVR